MNQKCYHTFNAFLREKFGEKVYRVSLDAGFTCPNRDGFLGTGGCIYCNEAGSRAGYVDPEIPAREQFAKGAEIIRRKYNARKFIAYFQAYTNTYAPPEKLREIYSEVTSHPDVVGISIGTRPDMIDPAKLDAVADAACGKWALIEYGAQSMRDETLRRIRRMHSVADTENAIRLTRERGIDVLAHVIFGLPGETPDIMKQSVARLVELGVNAFKFHHLYVEKGTALEAMYHRGEFEVIAKQDYMELLLEVIPTLPRETVIHRLFGQCSPDTLIAPSWTLHKNELIRELEKLLEKREISQGSATL